MSNSSEMTDSPLMTDCPVHYESKSEPKNGSNSYSNPDPLDVWLRNYKAHKDHLALALKKVADGSDTLDDHEKEVKKYNCVILY